jgi:hypothetical protein
MKTIQYCFEVTVASHPGIESSITFCGIAASAEEACARAKRYAEEKDLVNDDAHVVALKVLGEIDFGLPPE